MININKENHGNNIIITEISCNKYSLLTKRPSESANSESKTKKLTLGSSFPDSKVVKSFGTNFSELVYQPTHSNNNQINVRIRKKPNFAKKLPDEILYEIMSYLGFRDLINCSEVSLLFRNIALDHRLAIKKLASIASATQNVQNNYFTPFQALIYSAIEPLEQISIKDLKIKTIKNCIFLEKVKDFITTSINESNKFKESFQKVVAYAAYPGNQRNKKASEITRCDWVSFFLFTKIMFDFNTLYFDVNYNEKHSNVQYHGLNALYQPCGASTLSTVTNFNFPIALIKQCLNLGCVPLTTMRKNTFNYAFKHKKIKNLLNLFIYYGISPYKNNGGNSLNAFIKRCDQIKSNDHLPILLKLQSCGVNPSYSTKKAYNTLTLLEDKPESVKKAFQSVYNTNTTNN